MKKQEVLQKIEKLRTELFNLATDPKQTVDVRNMGYWISIGAAGAISIVEELDEPPITKDGYEVEKEPLYYVKFPVVDFNQWDLEAYLMKDDHGNILIADNNDFDDMKFTESDIKTIDERYWSFAVPVEEVAEKHGI